MSENNLPILKKRLMSAASFVRCDAVFADIGTDHAFLPIYLTGNGICRSAIAADINEMPLVIAKRNIERYGLSDRIECVLTSGFIGLDGRGITDGAVCGMGGELISEIITEADHLKHDGVRLILQPMTMPHITRRAVYENGFEIISEKTVFEDGKYYTVICADFTGKTGCDLSSFELLFGKSECCEFESEAVRLGYIDHGISKYERIVKGKLSAGISADDELSVIEKLKERKLK